jgi:hypothetical protein
MSSLDFEQDGLPCIELLQRRWFASVDAIRSLHAECALLFEAAALADAAWRRARGQLAELEAIRDALEQSLCTVDAPVEPRKAMARAEMSAA